MSGLEETVTHGMHVWVDGSASPGGHPQIDIVAVQGLGSDPNRTWVWKGDDRRTVWLRDLLPSDIPNARIASWGYNSRFGNRAPKVTLDICGKDLLVALSHHRNTQRQKEMPLIFIGHSFGGLVIKKALVMSHASPSTDKDLKKLFQSTVGIVFLGTPHDGASSAEIGGLIARFMRLMRFGWEDTLLNTLIYGSKELRKLGHDFATISSSISIVCFHEIKPTSVFTFNILFVDEQSATIEGRQSISLNCDHTQMNKFPSYNDPNYIKVLQELQQIAGLALEEGSRFMSPEEENILKMLQSPTLDCKPSHDGCLKGTREDILKEINAWVLDLDAPNILWIQGYPGVGKSAIASTLVSRLQRSRRLGSSFFFQREIPTTTKALWKKIAFDLSHRYVTVRAIVIAKLREVEDYSSGVDIDTLFRELIHEPLENSGNIQVEKLPVVVIDALDECGGLEGAKSTQRTRLMRTLILWSKLSKKFKLVVTSRKEYDIGRVFEKADHHTIDISIGHTTSSLKDIRTFLENRFTSVTDQYVSLSDEGWPGPQAIDELAQKAAGLFIWAETVIKFIHGGDPKTRLNRIMGGNNTGMTGLYSRILDMSFPSPDVETVTAFHAVVGTIIFARTPLYASSIAHMLSISRSLLDCICTGLQSVLDSNGLLRFNHQSFVDFLLDNNGRSSVFLIKQESSDRMLALGCLQTMKKGLKFNICGFESSYVRNRSIEDSEARVEKNVPQHLSYSSYFWMDHLAEVECDNDILGLVKIFMESLFLYWLEVLSVGKRFHLARKTFTKLTIWMRDNGQSDTMAKDMRQFVETFASCISEAAPHIYLSALAFSPPNSAVWNNYTKIYQNRIFIESGGHSNWPAIQNVLAGHRSRVNSVAASFDGTRIVSGSDDRTIRVWNAETGEMVVGQSQAHTDWVTSVSFSRDGTRIASGSKDMTIRVWDALTADMVAGPCKSHTNNVRSIAFLPNGTCIASGFTKSTIQVWNAETGEVVRGPFRGHRRWVTSVSISSDGACIASGSHDKTIRLWDAVTGELAASPFQGHEGMVTSVTFSSEGLYIVSGFNDNVIQIWNAMTGIRVGGPFRGHSGSVRSVTFSPDGTRIISGSDDKTVRVWNLESSDLVIGPFHGHSSLITSVAFSPHGTRIVSASNDCTVRVWDAEMGDPIGRPFQGHKGRVRSIAFSSDGTRIISGADDSTTQVWDARTGNKVAGPFKDHSSSVQSVAFSSDGSHIASGSDDKTIQVRNIVIDQLMATFEGHKGRVRSVAFSSNGARIVSGSHDKTIRMWEVETGEIM
ncbi:WD40 repeat-like protein, partial [Serendipita vermifera]